MNAFRAGTETRPTRLHTQKGGVEMILGKENTGAIYRFFRLFFVLLTAASLLACVVAAVPIIYYATKEGGVVVTAQIDRDVNEVWEATVRTAEKSQM